MASRRISDILGLEIEATGTATSAHEHSESCARDSRRQSHLGRGADRRRTQAEVRHKVSPRTVRKYLAPRPPIGCGDQRWTTFVRNHANAIVACDFLSASPD